MSIKQLLTNENKVIHSISQWEQVCIDIKRRLFETIGSPPIERNTRAIKIMNEEKLYDYIRCKISYVVGEGDKIKSYLLHPRGLTKPAPAVLALRQTVETGKDEVVGLNGNPDFAYGHELAKRGYIILAPDYLTAGERVSPNKTSFDSSYFYEQYPDWSMVGKNLEDSKSAIDVLCTLD